MIESIFSQLGFFGNFHPLVVHFPLALLPVAVLFKVLGYWRHISALQRSGDILLKLSLLFAVLAAFMGMTNARMNGHPWPEIERHASAAWLSILVLAFAIYLPAYSRRHGAVARLIGKMVRATGWLLAKCLWLLQWLLVLLLFPLAVLFWLLRKLYRASLGPMLNPLFSRFWLRARGSLVKLSGAVGRASNRRNWKRLGYGVALVLLAFTGLEGANMVHGAGHLARQAPAWASPWLGGNQEAADPTQFNALRFEKEVAPILRKNCMKCHGEDKSRGNLRLHTIDHIVGAGVVSFQSPMESEMLRRVLLSRDDPRAMPPKKNGRGLNASEVAALVAWINNEPGDAEGGGEYGPVIPPHYAEIATALPPIGDQQLQSLNRHGANVLRLQRDYSLMAVNLQFVESARMPEVLAALAPYSEHIVDLNLAGSVLAPVTVEAVAAMANLVRLNLGRSQATDADIERLADLRQLRWLNLYGTGITEAARDHLQAMDALETLYLGATALAEDPLEHPAPI